MCAPLVHLLCMVPTGKDPLLAAHRFPKDLATVQVQVSAAPTFLPPTISSAGFASEENKVLQISCMWGWLGERENDF